MKCKCKAKPKPDVTWFRGTTVVKESSKITIKIVEAGEDTYELSLEIKVRTSWSRDHACYTAPFSHSQKKVSGDYTLKAGVK